MRAPIYEFVKKYAEGSSVRMHMPGHKGRGPLGVEALDITEIGGADSLFEANGIISESEGYASELFGSRTLYSTEGSSLAIRGMVYLISLHAKERKLTPRILAARGVHKTFLSAAALTDVEVGWLYPKKSASYLSATPTPCEVEEAFSRFEGGEMPAALYITSPDYLGNMADVGGIAKVCRKYGVILAVDNAHGAYLNFLDKSLHPIALGADICCDSAHKTLPVLTGGAYLHISDSAPSIFHDMAKSALSLFASTSPSYLILASLDLCNAYLEKLREKLAVTQNKIQRLKRLLTEAGFNLIGDEPLKITVNAKAYGYTGAYLAEYLRSKKIECEFADEDYLVLMPSAETTEGELLALKEALTSLPRLEPIKKAPPELTRPTAAMTIREAMFSPCEEVDCCEASGRILASPSVSCPPAVPILICGEVIDEGAASAFKYYGVDKVCVVKSKK